MQVEHSGKDTVW